MRKKQILALALVMAIAAGAAGASSFVSNAAADFTQAKTASQVSYGSLTDEQLEIVNKYFDADFYANKYEDVVDALGTDRDMLYKHFIMCGIFEGRKGWADFDPSAYASAYPELRDTYGKNIPAYYVDFYKDGQAAGRNIVTIEACEAEGIEVISFFNEDELLSAEIFAASNLLGTSDYSTVVAAVDSAADNGVAIISTEEGDFVIATVENEEAIENATVEYEKLGILSVKGENKEVVIIVYKTETGFGTALHTDMNQYSDIENIIGFVPVVTMSVEEGNQIIDYEDYDIEHFDAESGMIIGTEGVTYITDDNNELNMAYYQPEDFESEHARMMVNYVDGRYVENAPIGIDENGTENTEYEISANAEADENGNAKVTTVISNEETGYRYQVSYTFDENPMYLSGVNVSAAE